MGASLLLTVCNVSWDFGWFAFGANQDIAIVLIFPVMSFTVMYGSLTLVIHQLWALPLSCLVKTPYCAVQGSFPAQSKEVSCQ